MILHPKNHKMDFWRSLLLMFVFAFPLMLLLLKKSEKPRNLPPSPKRLPIIGNLHQIGELPHVSLKNLADVHGPIMLLKLGSVPSLVVSSAKVARTIVKVHDVNFSGRPHPYAAKTISYNHLDMGFAPYGEYWSEVRKIASLELFSMKRVKSFRFVRDEEVISMLKYIAETCDSGPINLSDLTLSLSNNVVCRSAFGTQGEENTKYNGLLHEVQSLVGEVNIADYFPWLSWINKLNGVDERIEKTFTGLDKLYDKVIKEHRHPSSTVRPDEDGSKDFVGVLLEVQKDPNQTIRLSDDQIKGLCADIFIGGSVGSAATLEWTMAEIIRNPEIMKRAQEEVRNIAKGKQYVEESDLPKLHYLQMVIKESFRLHPPAPLLVPRITTEDCVVMGFDIPAKTQVFINAKAIGLDPECWEDPYSFKPERFLNSSNDYKRQDFGLIPFGVGRRGCPGLNFAMAWIELALANLLYRFDWKLPDGMKTDDIDMAESPGSTAFRKTPIMLVATPSRLLGAAASES